MVSNFVGREHELQALNKFHEEKGFQNIIIYGRRRVGKTELAIKFLEKKQGIYFFCKKMNINSQAQELVDKFAEKNNIFPKKVGGFEEAFEFIVSQLKNQRYIIIMDEFPYLVEEDKSILSIFQSVIDQYLKDTNIYLILLGSSISIMEKEVLGYGSPLYGRRTGQIKVNPFNFFDMHKFFKNKNFEELLEIYSITDGIPAYIKKIDSELSIYENIKKLFLSKEEFLFLEADFLLNTELREPKNYKRIIQAITNGKSRLTDISNEVKIPVNVITNYLDTLINLHILKKIYPITDKSLSRNSLYKIRDNYFSFWFKYVYSHMDLLEEDKSELVLNKIKLDLHNHISLIFEDVCRQFIKLKYDYLKVGSWWDKQNEIDIVAINDSKILFGECKWQERVNPTKIYYDLKKKSEKIKNNIKKEYVIFSKSFQKFEKTEEYTFFDITKIRL